MNNKRSKRNVIALTFACVLAAWCAAGTAAGSAAPPTPPECEGDACSQVTLTFDEAKEQYRVQNNSSDRWVRVAAANLGAAAFVCLAPGKEGRLNLKSVAGPYRADFAEAWCGAEGPVGSPPGGM